MNEGGKEWCEKEECNTAVGHHRCKTLQEGGAGGVNVNGCV